MAILTKLINQVTNTSKSPLQHFAKVDYCKVELSSPANFDEILKRFLDYLLWAPYFGLTKFTTFNYRVFSHVKEHFLSHSHHWCSLKTAFTNPLAYYSQPKNSMNIISLFRTQNFSLNKIIVNSAYMMQPVDVVLRRLKGASFCLNQVYSDLDDLLLVKT